VRPPYTKSSYVLSSTNQQPAAAHMRAAASSSDLGSSTPAAAAVQHQSRLRQHSSTVSSQQHHTGGQLCPHTQPSTKGTAVQEVQSAGASKAWTLHPAQVCEQQAAAHIVSGSSNLQQDTCSNTKPQPGLLVGFPVVPLYD
jgi:hypothetical protein